MMANYSSYNNSFAVVDEKVFMKQSVKVVLLKGFSWCDMAEILIYFL